MNAYKNAKREMETVRRPFKLGIGLGPAGRETKTVSMLTQSAIHERHLNILLGAIAQFPPQWINCDLRRFDYSVLGKFHAIMADPPWDIHMSVSDLVPFI